MKNNRLTTILGFAQKAGKLSSGDETCELYLKKRRIKLIILASDAAENTKERWLGLGKAYSVPVLILLDRETLSHAVGKANRTVFGVMDAGFAGQVKKLISEPGTEQGE